MNNVKISAPWVTYAHKIKAMFGEDPDIRIQYDDVENKITLRVDGTDKAAALVQLLPAEKTISGTTVRIDVVPSNKQQTKADLIEDALKGNPIFSKILKVNPGSGNTFTYAVFRKKVCQFWDDNLGDPHGNISTLYQELAREIFGEDDGILYCTDNINGDVIW